LLRPLDREVLRLAVPATAALAAEPAYVLADTAIVGRLGTPQLGGLAVAGTALLAGHSLFVFLAYGTTATVARRLGAGDERGAAAAGVTALWLAAGIGLAVTVVGLALAGPMVGALGADGAVRPHALTYLRISLLGVPALLVSLGGMGYLRGVQDTRTTMVVAVGGATANLGLEVLLVLVLDLGVAGSAWSTVAVQVVVALVYGRRVLAVAAALGVHWRPEPQGLRRQAGLGRDLFVRTAALRLSLTMATAVAARLGVADLGANAVAFELWSFLALVLDGLAIAGQALVGRLLGAADGDGAREAGRRLLQWGAGVGLAVGVAVAVLHGVLPDLFTDDPAVVERAQDLLLVVALLQPVNGLVFVLDGILIGAGDLRFLALAMVGAMLVFVPAAALVLVLDLGLAGLWAAVALLMLVRLAALARRFVGGGWVVLGLPA
jgi:putative MATE family efflux protein